MGLALRVKIVSRGTPQPMRPPTIWQSPGIALSRLILGITSRSNLTPRLWYPLQGASRLIDENGKRVSTSKACATTRSGSRWGSAEAVAGVVRTLFDPDDLSPLWPLVPERRRRPRQVRTQRARDGSSPSPAHGRGSSSPPSLGGVFHIRLRQAGSRCEIFATWR